MGNETEKKPIKFLDIIKNLDIIVSGIALVMLVVITFLGVIARRIFNSPFQWGEEMQIMCTIWMVFIASGAVFRTVDHISIELIVDNFKGRLRWIVDLLIYLVVMATLAFTLYRSVLLVQQLVVTGRTTNILKLPYFLVYIPFPIGCVLMMVSDTIVTIKKLFCKHEDETEKKEENAE